MKTRAIIWSMWGKLIWNKYVVLIQLFCSLTKYSIQILFYCLALSNYDSNETMYISKHISMSQNKIGTNICFTLNLLGHHFDYDHHFIMAFILQPFFHKLGSQGDLQRIRFMPPKSESHLF